MLCPAVDISKTIAEITTDLEALGVDGSEVIYSCCRTGYIASTGYFVLDAILGWDVMLYDFFTMLGTGE